MDWRHDLSEELTSENETASALLDMAEGIAEQYKVKLTDDLLQARDVAAALVDEAIEVGADAIIVGLPYRQALRRRLRDRRRDPLRPRRTRHAR